MNKKLIHGNEHKAWHRRQLDKTNKCMHVYTQWVHACGYQIDLRVLLQTPKDVKSYEERLLIEVESSLIDVCFPFV